MSEALIPVGPQGLMLTQEKIELLKRTVCKGATDDELQLFLHVCNRTGLDPFARQIHAIKRREKRGNEWVDVMAIQTGIDGYRLTAQRTKRYRGQTPPEWCGKDGVWTEVWLQDDPPAAARIGVYAADFDGPVYAVVNFNAYVARHPQTGKPMARWADDGAGMLAKCAEALALRKAFPQELSGIYADVEMGQFAQDPETPKVQMPKPIADPPKQMDPPPPGADPEEKYADTPILSVTEQSGKQRSGQAWMLYRLQCANQVQYSTFDKHIGEAAKLVSGTGEIVRIYYKHTPKGEEVTAIGMPEEPIE